MQSYGLQPGPALFDNEPLLVWTLLAGLFIANTLLVVQRSVADWRHLTRPKARSSDTNAR